MNYSLQQIDLSQRNEIKQCESRQSLVRLAANDRLTQYYDKERKRTTLTFSDIRIKVQTQVYHLSKVMLALKSGYFEKLFARDFEEKNCQEIEINMIPEDTFSSIVEIIYGADVKHDVVQESNFAFVFMAMDYLQMEIVVDIFRDILNLNRNTSSLDFSDVFKLHNVVTMLPEYESMLKPIYSYLSSNLLEMSRVPEFLFLTPAALIEIIITTHEEKLQEKHYIGKICASWICHDIQNRLACLVDLVNAAKYRFQMKFAVTIGENYKNFFLDEKTREERIWKYFNKLLDHSTMISLQPFIVNRSQPKSTSYSNLGNNEPRDLTVHNKIDLETKWKEFLKHQSFCDVSVKVGEDIFHLHRIKLSSNIPYFHDLFTTQETNQDEYSLDAAIDATSFRKIINYVYHEELDLINECPIGHLLQTCKILRMQQLIENIYKHFRENLDLVKDNIFDLVPFAFEDENFSKLCNGLETYIGNTWNELCHDEKFYQTTLKIAEYVIALPNLQLFDEQNILDVCSKWIFYDVENRYKFIPELALAINRNCIVDYEHFNVPMPEDSSTISKKHIQDQLDKILISTQLLPSSTVPLHSNLIETPTPCFIASKDDELSIMDAEFNEIMSIPFLKLISSRNLSAAIIDDHLFILFHNQHNFSFLAVDLVSRKIKSLTFDPSKTSSNFYLLNCNSELYFCANQENMLSKYSNKLNRWIQFLKMGKIKKSKICKYTSDGKVLYRVLKSTHRSTDHINAQVYNYSNQQFWIQLPHMPIETSHMEVKDVSTVNGNLCVLFDSCTVMYKEEERKWEKIVRKNEKCTPFEIFKQFEDNILYVTDSRQLWQFSITDKLWQSKRKLGINVNAIVAIHSVRK